MQAIAKHLGIQVRYEHGFGLVPAGGDEAWYHVLVHDAAHTTYVAEQNLVTDPTPKDIRHPLVNEFFSGFDGRRYISRQRPN